MSNDEAGTHISARWWVGELEELATPLQQVYLALAGVYLEAGAELNDYVIEDYLPTKIFETAQLSGWVSKSAYQYSNTLGPNARPAPDGYGWIDPDCSSIGKWIVSTAFRDAFYETLSPAIESLRTLVAASAGSKATWVTPTPAELVKTFLDDKRWTKAKLIDAMADKKPGSLAEAVKKQLRVIVTEPPTPTFLKDYHVVLCDVMRENSESFESLEPLSLVWRYQR